MDAELRTKLETIRDDPSRPDRLRRTAAKRLKDGHRAEDRAAQERKRQILDGGPVYKYKIGGIWKLSRSIPSHAGYDKNGNETFGYSDRV